MEPTDTPANDQTNSQETQTSVPSENSRLLANLKALELGVITSQKIECAVYLEKGQIRTKTLGAYAYMERRDLKEKGAEFVSYLHYDMPKILRGSLADIDYKGAFQKRIGGQDFVEFEFNTYYKTHSGYIIGTLPAVAAKLQDYADSAENFQDFTIGIKDILTETNTKQKMAAEEALKTAGADMLAAYQAKIAAKKANPGAMKRLALAFKEKASKVLPLKAKKAPSNQKPTP